jgi:hypothetical protein
MMPARVLEPFDDTPLECALAYAQCGIRVLPIKPGEKRPPMPAWQDAATTDTATIGNWFRGLYADHGVGLAMGHQPDGRIIFAVDVDEHDPARSGSETIHALEQQHGNLPDTVRAITGAGGLHLLFAAPTEIRNGNIGDGVDIRGHGGQIVTFPSIHPTTQRRYEWEAGYAPWEHPIADAPAWLVDLARPPEPRPAPSTPTAASSGDTPADHIRHTWNWHTELAAAGWTLHHSEANGDTHWTRPGKDRREGASAVLHAPDGPFNVFTTDPSTADLRRLGKPGGAGLVSISPFEFYAATKHAGDISIAARTIRETMPEPSFAIASSRSVDTATGEIRSFRNLPNDFWEARLELSFIRQAAHSRARSADAVLLFTLARLVATIPPQIRLPPIVGGAASLNFLGSVVGSSGSGKSTAGDVARDLAPINRTDVVADIPLGSGEGIAEQYFEWISEEQPDGKRKQVKRQTKSSLYVMLDEGQALGEMGSRKGATLLPTLRSAWSGQTIGNTNASAETRRIVPAHSYRLALMVGFQAEHAVGLIDDAAGGTPQRFVFASANDPNIPDVAPAWPGTLDMTPPSIFGEQHVEVAAPIAAEIRVHNLALARGQITIDPLDSHHQLVRLKVAALLSYLDGRSDVNADDWELAKVIMATSNAVRSWVIEIARSRALADEMAGHHRAARREEVVADAVTNGALRRAARAVGRRATKVDVMSLGDVSRAISSRDKKLVDVEDVIDEAVRMGWIEALGTGDGWRSGKAKPT